jgi:signal transduction histidine kinase
LYVLCVTGIAVEDQPRLFRQFVQFNRNALQGGGGSGLGLWICKSLASFHGGRMVRCADRLHTFLPTFLLL